MDIRKVDLNLLAVLDAMLEQQSVTRAGSMLGLSQPAMSAALAKLRAQFDDPLFVRTGRGMKATPRALALADPVHRVLDTIREEILQNTAFDPSSSDRTFTIITPDIGEVVLLPRLVGLLRATAPCIRLRALPLRAAATAEALESGAADLAVGYFPDLATAGFYQQRLFRNSFVCIVRADHPWIGEQVTLKQFLEASHAVVRPAGRSHLFDQYLDERKLIRHVPVDIGHFTSLLTIIAESDLIATVPRDVGFVFSRLARIRLVEPPVSPPPFDVKQHWHRRVHNDAANIWLRRTVHEVFHD